MQSPLILTLHFDGGIHPNPGGVPRFGWHIDDSDGNRIADASGRYETDVLAERTNNTAEWCGLRAGLLWLIALRVPIDELHIRGDSQLIVYQFTGRMKAKKPHLARFRDECRRLLDELNIGHVDVRWIPREENERADSLAGV